MLLQKAFDLLEKIYPEMVDIRRDLHMHPEISFQEKRTPEMIAKYLEDLGLEVKTKVGGNGVVGRLKGGKPGKTLALRADFDALLVNDEKDAPYKSKVPGVSHACGHDIHTGALLGVAKVLSHIKDELEGEVVFLHQHAEEMAPGGAKAMVEDGCLEGVDEVYGAHVEVNFPIGSVALNDGYVQASSDAFDITIKGKGGHAAEPHRSKDPVIIGSHLVVDLQNIVSRRVDPLHPALVTVGAFQSGDTHNVIPDKAYLKGTVRTYDQDVRDQVENELKLICEKTGEKHGVTIDVNYNRGYISLYNHPEQTEYIKKLSTEIVGEENVTVKPPDMGGEDFAYYVDALPGTFFWIGGGNPEINAFYPHHHPKFDVDEKSMLIAGKVFLSAVINRSS
ncbi:M20 metallopeptidase family protein [Pseudalkalibacillus salsuginis]|uniref:M20 metallopeptidase family protein n=1 Tax=Pseudalkalibacillus salsuginis TaxID=2910972 RepID=UPI001F37F441|nr:amidohydrolase [Pseudalkalibacillus salsuginis]MCF6409768.1 amidohydrolase [Pseudalkalibacillus salsuginis]